MQNFGYYNNSYTQINYMEGKLKQEADKFIIMGELRQQNAVHVVWLSLVCMDSYMRQISTPKAERKYFIIYCSLFMKELIISAINIQLSS